MEYDLLRMEVPFGEPAPMLPYPVYMTGIPPVTEHGSFTDTNFEPGYSYYYSIVAINDVEERTEACEPVGIDVK